MSIPFPNPFGTSLRNLWYRRAFDSRLKATENFEMLARRQTDQAHVHVFPVPANNFIAKLSGGYVEQEIQLIVQLSRKTFNSNSWSGINVITNLL